MKIWFEKTLVDQITINNSLTTDLLNNLIITNLLNSEVLIH